MKQQIRKGRVVIGRERKYCEHTEVQVDRPQGNYWDKRDENLISGHRYFTTRTGAVSRKKGTTGEEPERRRSKRVPTDES